MTELIPAEKAELIKQAIEEMQDKTKSLVIKDDVQMQHASHVLAEIKARIKRLDDLKRELTKPFADAVKQANMWFSYQREPFAKMEMFVKAKISEYIDKKEREARAEQKRLEEERERREEEAREKGEPAPAPLTPAEQPKAQVRTEAGLVSSRKIWTYEITDESKVPRGFLMVNNAEITKAVRNGKRRIAGVKIFQRTSIAVS